MNPSAAMPSTSSSTPSSIAGGGVKEGKEKQIGFSPPSDEASRLPTDAITYDPPPASWFFGRGGKKNSNQAGEQTRSENNAKREHSSSNTSTGHPSPWTKDRNIHQDSSPDWGMVSENEDEDDLEGFNFIAVSNSLLMAGRSFEHVPKKQSGKEDADSRSGTSSNQQRGVLIVDGLSSDNSEDGTSSPVVGSTNHNNDASVLTIPGSDSLPSDIGTIDHHEDDEDEDHSDPLLGEGSGDESTEQGNQDQPEVPEDPSPLVHRFLNNLKRTRRLRLVSDASDENGDGSVVRNDDEEFSVAWTVDAPDDLFRGIHRKVLSKRRSLPIIALVVLSLIAFSYRSFVTSQRREREAWEQRLNLEKEAMARLLSEKESLRQEMEILLEEAAVASARADSLVKEQERLLFEREVTEREEKERIRLVQEQEQRKQQERQNQKRRRKQPWRSNFDDDEDFGCFLDQSNEECSGHQKDEPTTISIADNCWIKAKADINLGSCGGETKHYINDIWNGLWEDWDYYFDEPARNDGIEPYSTTSGDANEEKEVDDKQLNKNDNENDYHRIGSGNDQQDYNDEGHNYQYQDDTYYPPQDPLQDLFSVIHSAGESFVNKMSNLMSDEVESTQNAAREMEEAVTRKFSEASQTISGAMEIAKEDMRDLSKDALSALRAAVQKSSGNNHQKKTSDTEEQSDGKKGANSSPPTQQVTRKVLSDAATTVAMLSKSWQDYTNALTTAQEGTEK